MEQIISNLVQDFEKGKMTRRQLIQSLAITATTAASAISLAPAVAAQNNRLISAVAFNHISYLAEDCKKTVAWYEDLFGMQRYLETEISCNLAFGPSNGPYMVFRDVKHPEAVTHPNNSLNYIDHVAYQIENWDANAVETELKRRGLNPKPNGKPVNSYYVEDPNGIGVQITRGMDASRATMKP